MFSHGSSSSTSLAIVTPSLVIVGAPHFLSSTTFWPLGPSVIATASASLSTPASRPRRASSPNFSSFEATGVLLFLIGRCRPGSRSASPPATIWLLLPDDGEDVASREDLVLGPVGVLPLRAAVLRVDDDVADGDVDRDAGVAVLVELPGADRDDGALTGFSFAVSGITSPEAVVSSASLGCTMIRSSSGLSLKSFAIPDLPSVPGLFWPVPGLVAGRRLALAPA